MPVTAALTAALFRLDVGTAVFEPKSLTPSEKHRLRCCHQLDGSVAVILEPVTQYSPL
jgi:hypothetical protein